MVYYSECAYTRTKVNGGNYLEGQKNLYEQSMIFIQAKVKVYVYWEKSHLLSNIDITHYIRHIYLYFPVFL